MPFVLNLKTEELAPHFAPDPRKPREFMSENAVIVSDKQAIEISKHPAGSRDAVITKIIASMVQNGGGVLPAKVELDLRNRLRRNPNVLGDEDDGAHTHPDAPVNNEDKANVESVSVSVVPAGPKRLTREQIRKLSQGDAVSYANNVLGLDLPKNTHFALAREAIMKAQFGGEED